MRILENQLKSLGEEPNSRTKHSSSGSDSDVEYQSGQESKLKELQTSLEQEREQRCKIENELCQLKANAPKINTEVWTKILRVQQYIELSMHCDVDAAIVISMMKMK